MTAINSSSNVWYNPHTSTHLFTKASYPTNSYVDGYQPIELQTIEWIELSRIIQNFVNGCKFLDATFTNLHLVNCLIQDLKIKNNADNLIKQSILSKLTYKKFDSSNLFNALNMLKQNISFVLVSQMQEEKNTVTMDTRKPGIFYAKTLLDHEWQLVPIPISFVQPLMVNDFK